MPWLPIKSILLLAIFSLGPAAFAGFDPVWTLGNVDGNPLEFGQDQWGTVTPPGSASVLDDDYYFAGNYPVPIGLVAVDEPIELFERAVSTGSPTCRIHFPLSAAQATGTLRLRFVAQLIWGGWWDTVADEQGTGFGSHLLEVRLNGALIGSTTMTRSGALVVEANEGTFTPVVGANVLEISRAGGTPEAWIAFDALSLDAHPTALLDADSDGLPRWWEEDQGLSDSFAGDATADHDGDGLTAVQEFAKQTFVHLADSDGDGLKDGDEVSTDPLRSDTDGDSLGDGFELAQLPPLNPLLIDSDADGSPDAWESRTGYAAGNAGSVPPAFAAAVGLQFVSELHDETGLSPIHPAGFVPQMNWNVTLPLTTWAKKTGGVAEIGTPIAGSLVNAAGTVTAMTATWTAENTWGSSNSGSPDQNLFSGYLQATGLGDATLVLSGIPYSNYNVIVYVGSVYDGALGAVELNGNPATERWFSSGSSRPETRFIQPPLNDQNLPRRGNTLVYENVTGAQCSIRLASVNGHGSGIHAVQIVDAGVDLDSDGMPDWWELANRLKHGSGADAGLDPDTDGLTNVQEFARKTSPHLADTDGDGLSDAAETGTGVWVGATNTGSDPLVADSDQDGLTDGEEATRDPLPTNPNLADTDADGRDDAEEARHHTDPLVADATAAMMPVVTVGPRTFEWDVSGVQLLWDHTRGETSDGPWSEDFLVIFGVENSALNWDTLRVGLRASEGMVTHFFYSSKDGAFSAAGEPGGDIWESDWSQPPVDLKGALGFSGYGQDLSARLRFRLVGSSSGSAGAWNFTFTLTNQDSGATVVTRTFNNSTLAANVHNGSATWQDDSEPPVPNRLAVDLHPGVRLFFSGSPLENSLSFAAIKDTDNDGMPDVWEDAHGLNKNSSADAGVDTEPDGLSNLREFLAGTDPDDRDTDNDLASDGAEVAAGSDPLLASSLPPYWHGAPGVGGEDFNSNGIADGWELMHGAFSLLPLGDDDLDGVSNEDEAIAGTDPTDPQSRLWSAVLTSGADLTLCWPALDHKQEVLLQNQSLGSIGWLPAPGTLSTVGDERRLLLAGVLSEGADRRFYRVAVSDLDSDMDGVSDWTEALVVGSDPYVANSTQAAQQIDANSDGYVDSTVSGDFLTLATSLHGATAEGGFPVPGTNAVGQGISRPHAARFLMQAAFGPTLEDIAEVQSLGYEAWIANQVTKVPTLHSVYIRGIQADLLGQRTDLTYSFNDTDNFINGNNMMTAFARAAIQGEDQLRQRVAFALSQILVTSRRDANLENRPVGMADFYDIFVRNAFGNYLDVLREVTLHPVMGRYLSHVGNQKARPEINQYPDENYAREVMQLFTIGLWQLNPDGTRQVDGGGQNIPTYSNAEITQMARVLTGLWFGGHGWGQGGWSDPDLTTPLTMHSEYHDFGSKTLVGGFQIASRAPTTENALRDIDDAIRHLFEHPNTGPFIGRQLIQFLVTDNPTPGYVQRVAAVFADNGSGVRGDLGAVVKAILLDTEARNSASLSQNPNFGRLKEPVIRTMAMARAFGMKEVQDLLWWDWSTFYDAARQEPTRSPSVFNFYRPDHRPPGVMTQQDLAGPVFQITDSYSAIAFPNHLWSILEGGFNVWRTYSFPLDLSREVALASDPERLVDHLNLMLCAGSMRASTRSIILSNINAIPASDRAARARVAAYLALTAPEGAVMK